MLPMRRGLSPVFLAASPSDCRRRVPWGRLVCGLLSSWLGGGGWVACPPRASSHRRENPARGPTVAHATASRRPLGRTPTSPPRRGRVPVVWMRGGPRRAPPRVVPG
eukprot:8100662-Alexandrium_andersonii.AAC.1